MTPKSHLLATILDLVSSLCDGSQASIMFIMYDRNIGHWIRSDLQAMRATLLSKEQRVTTDTPRKVTDA